MYHVIDLSLMEVVQTFTEEHDTDPEHLAREWVRLRDDYHTYQVVRVLSTSSVNRTWEGE